MVTRFALISLLVLVLAGCVTAPPTPTPAPVTKATPTPAAAAPSTGIAPTFVGRLRNAKYQLGTPDTLQVVQLKNGEFESGVEGSAEFVSVKMLNFVASGDLNGDGRLEAVALVSENYGGSGVFVFLTVYADVNGTLTFQSSLLVDDRPQPNELSIADGEVLLDVLTHGPEEPMCCPTLRTTRRYRLDHNNQLDMVEYATFTPDGRPRTITIEAPPNGSQVYSSVQVRGAVAVAPFENNLAYRIFDVGGVELAAGAIPVVASEPGGPGTFDSRINLGKILSGAVIRFEVQDLSAENGSLLAMDSVELVVK